LGVAEAQEGKRLMASEIVIGSRIFSI